MIAGSSSRITKAAFGGCGLRPAIRLRFVPGA